MERTSPHGRRASSRSSALALLTTVIVLAATDGACLARPVGTVAPTTKVNFTTDVVQQQVDKVDLLFMIDNSSSMGDKQLILKDAVPNLLVGLLNPKCIDASGAPVGDAFADPGGGPSDNYRCPEGSEPEFRPITDMHIAVVSSSLGSFGGDVCPEGGPRQNDGARLLTNGKPDETVEAAHPSGFLAWFPANEENANTERHPAPENPTADFARLSSAFGDLVTGAGQEGCGFEAQLESVYRFLVQPDPWVKVTVDPAHQSDLGGAKDVDYELLKQRADFLRDDSLLAIIELTDEDDSSPDPMAVGGQGWAFASFRFPQSSTYRDPNNAVAGTTAPRATSACATNPASPDCTSCIYALDCDASKPACQKVKSDPECAKNGGFYGATDDSLNVRFHRMKERFGLDPQYPVRRYVEGFTKYQVPDRSTEHATRPRDPADPAKGREIAAYTGEAKCTNPIFARNRRGGGAKERLPRAPGDELCALERGTRTPGHVFFAVVGGVPNELLHFDPNSIEGSRITDEDWTRILGRDPAAFDFSGIDAHMIQSISPRAGVPPPSDARGDNGSRSDPVGREWDTKKNDLQYACTFALPQPRRCSGAPGDSCDCEPGKNPPLCGSEVGVQVRAKAYPTVRELMVVRALGEQGIVASLCPITLEDDPAKGGRQNPLYGYNPAVKTIVDRLKTAIVACLPQELKRDDAAATGDGAGAVPCLVLATLGEGDSCAKYGLEPPPKDVLDTFREQQAEENGDPTKSGVDVTKRDVCKVPQLVVPPGETCKRADSLGWCYVEATADRSPAGACSRAIVVSSRAGTIAQATFAMQCIQQFEAGEAAGDTAR